MHSSRTHTAHSLTASCSACQGGMHVGACMPGGVRDWECVCPEVACVAWQGMLGYTHTPPPVDRILDTRL